MIYFDNSATTQPCNAAIAAAEEMLRTQYGNPSSRHSLGFSASQRVKEARESCARLLHAKPGEIVFTASGSEANNQAILKGANPKVGRHIVTTMIEHPSVGKTVDYLEETGCSVTRVAPKEDGGVRAADLIAALTPDTALVTVMHVNNETGAVLPVMQLKRAMRDICPRALLHCDCVQSFGKLPILPEKWGVDMLSFSAHKIHGIKGVGGLYVSGRVKIKPLIHGGGQENGLRSGTENTVGIAALGAAANEVDFSAAARVAEVKECLKQGVLTQIPDTVWNGGEGDSPYILNLSFVGIRSEIMLNALSAEGICVSSGSACAATKATKSHVLAAMGAREADSAIRFSFSRQNTIEEAEQTLHVLKKITEAIRSGKGLS